MNIFPAKFKHLGYIICPSGFLVWLTAQVGLLDNLLAKGTSQYLHHFQITLSLSFLLFIMGLFFIIFAKEKVEDEFIKHLRLESFQKAAIFQFFLLILYILAVLLTNWELNDSGLELFLIANIFTYWLIYILSFQISLRKSKTTYEE